MPETPNTFAITKTPSGFMVAPVGTLGEPDDLQLFGTYAGFCFWLAGRWGLGVREIVGFEPADALRSLVESAANAQVSGRSPGNSAEGTTPTQVGEGDGQGDTPVSTEERGAGGGEGG